MTSEEQLQIVKAHIDGVGFEYCQGDPGSGDWHRVPEGHCFNFESNTYRRASRISAGTVISHQLWPDGASSVIVYADDDVVVFWARESKMSVERSILSAYYQMLVDGEWKPIA